MVKVSLSKIDELFALIASNGPMYLPVDEKEGRSAYKMWEQGDKWSDKLNTARSPKDFFFPQMENLMAFKTEGKNIQIIDTRKEEEDFVVFGLRACDVRAFDVLDNVFLKDPVDTYYENRRKHATLVAVSCNKPSETCFCHTFGIDPVNPGADVSAWKDDEFIYFTANTSKGESLLSKVSLLTEKCKENAADDVKAKTQKIMEKLPLANLSADAFGGDKTDAFFKDPAWAQLSESCLGCGTCTFVCPTCQCYDIKDFNTGNGVVRFRCWDSCMYKEFTKMSAGQPRLTQLERFRQRFMHKLVYYPANNNGMFSCVGCGRCMSRCPISMNIVKVMKTLGGDK